MSKDKSVCDGRLGGEKRHCEREGEEERERKREHE